MPTSKLKLREIINFSTFSPFPPNNSQNISTEQRNFSSRTHQVLVCCCVPGAAACKKCVSGSRASGVASASERPTSHQFCPSNQLEARPSLPSFLRSFPHWGDTTRISAIQLNNIAPRHCKPYLRTAKSLVPCEVTALFPNPTSRYTLAEGSLRAVFS